MGKNSVWTLRSSSLPWQVRACGHLGCGNGSCCGCLSSSRGLLGGCRRLRCRLGSAGRRLGHRLRRRCSSRSLGSACHCGSSCRLSLQLCCCRGCLLASKGPLLPLIAVTSHPPLRLKRRQLLMLAVLAPLPTSRCPPGRLCRRDLNRCCCKHRLLLGRGCGRQRGCLCGRTLGPEEVDGRGQIHKEVSVVVVPCLHPLGRGAVAAFDDKLDPAPHRQHPLQRHLWK